jgi:hypothetical protein
VLQYFDFFSSNIQRKAILTAANCCRNLTKEFFSKTREVVHILENLIYYSDEKGQPHINKNRTRKVLIAINSGNSGFTFNTTNRARFQT